MEWGLIMQRRRFLAVLALAGLASPARAAPMDECFGRGDYSTVSTTFNSVLIVQQGGAVVDGTARDEWRRQWNTTPAIEGVWSAEATVPSGALEISIYLTSAGSELIPNVVVLYKDDVELVRVEGADLEQYDMFSDYPRYSVYLGDSTREDRGQIVAAQSLIDGDALQVRIELTNGRALTDTLQFANLGLRRAQAQQMAREDLARYQAGSCELRTGSCYLTTAAVGVVGLADDCWELRTLRAFRDGPLLSMPGGADLIADYYRHAPALVARISTRADATQQWLRVWLFGIMPSACAARLGMNRLALHLYSRMARRLESLAA